MLHITLSTGHTIVADNFEFTQNNEVRITTIEARQVMFEICMSIKGSQYTSAENTFVCSFGYVENIYNVGE